jgi:peroxiredoxin
MRNRSNYNYERFMVKPYIHLYKKFQSLLPVGSVAPNFALVDTDGREVSLSDFRGKSNVVLVFGCMTCAPAVGQLVSNEHNLSKLAAKYQQGVEFLSVYTREAHPGEKISKHASFHEKLLCAVRFRQEDGVQLRVLVDDVQGTVHRKYGLLPNMVYIINKEGRIVYRASWTDSRDVESALDNLLLWEQLGESPMDSIALVEKYHFIHDRDLDIRKRVYGRAGEKAVEDLRREIQLPI